MIKQCSLKHILFEINAFYYHFNILNVLHDMQECNKSHMKIDQMMSYTT